MAGWLAGLFSGGLARGRTDYLTDVWTADNGLPSSSVTDIAQTPDGYLWVGTYNGLVRFDGVRFVTFDPANVPALGHARVRRLAVDTAGTLYINTYDGSLTSFRHGVFAREWAPHDDKDPDVTLVTSANGVVTFLLHRGSLRRRALAADAGTDWEDVYPPERSVGALTLADGAGTVWYRGTEQNLWRLAGGQFEPHPVDEGLGDAQIECLATDAAGQLWAGTDQGIFRRAGRRFEAITPTNDVPAGTAEALSINADGSYWALVNGRVREARDRQWVAEAVALRQVFTGSLTQLGARPDHHGGMWLYAYQRGLHHVDAQGEARHFDAELGFPGDRINAFFEDREGNWWAGLNEGGLARIRERRFQIPAAGQDPAAKPAQSVCADARGTVWIGTLGNGLQTWSATGTPPGPPPAGGPDTANVFCVYPDAAGRLWGSSGQEDLYIVTSNGWQRITPSVHGVKAICVDAAGQVWAGTKNGLFTGHADAPHHFQANPTVGGNGIRALAGARDGSLWAGAEDGTLYHIVHGVTTAFQPADNPTPQTAIWSLLPEADGTVWVGTFRGGLLRFRDGQFTRFSRREGLPDNVICQILDDRQGYLWLGSHQGIFRVAKADLDRPPAPGGGLISTVGYGRSDGLPSMECSGGYQPSAWRGQDGRLWFTTLKGAVAVQPRELHPNLLPPPVVIENVLVDGQSVEAPGGSPANAENPLGIEYDRARPVVIPPGRHQIEFQYTGISLVAPERVKFRYQLAGADAGWIEAGNRRTVQYGYLPPGKYQFKVLAGNSDGQWNLTGDALAVVVQPYFYETWWFRLLAAIVVIGGVSGFLRHTATLRLRRKMERLERQHELERERTRIAQDIHDDLGASLTLIAVLGDLAKKEKTSDRIEKMSGLAREAVKSLDEIVWAVNPRNDTLAHLIDYAGQFATDYLRDAGIRCLLDFPEQSPAREVPANVRHNLFLVVKEALQNIVKHAAATEVWLRITVTSQGLRVVVEDNGRGFVTPPENALADGLRNIRQRLQEIGGQCRIESRPGAGTVITIELAWPTA
jgi:signal transduction histidine kinase/ligand-binding sensor domain-containing protein